MKTFDLLENEIGMESENKDSLFCVKFHRHAFCPFGSYHHAVSGGDLFIYNNPKCPLEGCPCIAHIFRSNRSSNPSSNVLLRKKARHSCHYSAVGRVQNVQHRHYYGAHYCQKLSVAPRLNSIVSGRCCC